MTLARSICAFAAGLALLLTPLLSETGLALPPQTAETSLSELQQQWKDLDAKLVAVETDIKSATGDVQANQKEFRALVEEANVLINKIESAAKVALVAEPENQEIVRTLMGIMLNDAEQNNDAKVLTMGDLLIANGVNPEYFTIASRSDRLTIPAREIFDELLIRHAEAMAADLPRVKFTTTKGDIVLELFENEAPNTVGNFVSLVENGTYTDSLFHRVVEGFMAQGGGFKMDGEKEVGGEGPGYEIKCECFSPDKRLHFTGSLSMAHRGKDTGGSQFFLTFSRTSFLDGGHTCFGRVIEGADVLDSLTRTHIGRTATNPEQPIPGAVKDKIIKAEVLRKREHEYRPDKVGGNDEPEPELSAPKDPEMKAEALQKGDAEQSDSEKADPEKADPQDKPKADPVSEEKTKPDENPESEKASAPKKDSDADDKSKSNADVKQESATSESESDPKQESKPEKESDSDDDHS